MKDFAARIRKIRNAKDYSQEYVSMQLGITMSAYSKIERGITDPSLSRMMQIAAILEFELADFFKLKIVQKHPIGKKIQSSKNMVLLHGKSLPNTSGWSLNYRLN